MNHCLSADYMKGHCKVGVERVCCCGPLGRLRLCDTCFLLGEAQLLSDWMCWACRLVPWDACAAVTMCKEPVGCLWGPRLPCRTLLHYGGWCLVDPSFLVGAGETDHVHWCADRCQANCLKPAVTGVASTRLASLQQVISLVLSLWLLMLCVLVTAGYVLAAYCGSCAFWNLRTTCRQLKWLAAAEG